MPASSTARRLTRLERAAVYGLSGVTGEVGFTAVVSAASRHRRRNGGRRPRLRLEGHTYLWMLPTYGLAAVLFEPLHDRLRGQSAWRRATCYAVGITAVEQVTGSVLHRLIGEIPWDYTGRSRFVLPGGAVRADYLPVWACMGLVLERIHDRLQRLAVMTAAEP